MRKRPLGVNPGYIHNRDLASFQVPGPDVYLSHNILFFLKGNLGVEAGNSSTPSHLAGGKISAVRYLLYLPMKLYGETRHLFRETQIHLAIHPSFLSHRCTTLLPDEGI